MLLTIDNAPEYEDKLLDSSRMLFHYYPLRIKKHPSMGWVYVGRFGVMMRVPAEGIYFDSVREDKKGA